MGGPHVDPLPGFRVDPAGEDAPAREHERVRPVPVDDGKFEIAIEGRVGNRLPHIAKI